MKKNISIAIDGVAGAGKSTVAKTLAKKLNIICFNTGDIYRTIALHTFRQNINNFNEAAVEDSLSGLEIKIEFDSLLNQHTYLNNEDVTNLLHTEGMSKGSGEISVYAAVREYVRSIQRKIISENSVVIEGRDIGTVVAPNADVKIFLTAAIEVRTKRRLKELLESGEAGVTYEKVMNEILIRDASDEKRTNSPLKKADDAILIDTSNISVDEIINQILNIIKRIK